MPDRALSPNAMPIKTARIEFDDVGYPWYAVVRTNPRSSTYDTLMALGDGWWAALGEIVLEWNLADEQGAPFPLPLESNSETALNLPHGVLTFLFERYIDEVKAAAVPKSRRAESATTSSTSGAPLNGE